MDLHPIDAPPERAVELMPRPLQPEEGETWIEKDGGAEFTVEHVNHWKYGSITIQAIHAPLMRLWTGPVESFVEKFEPSKEAAQ